MKVRKDKCCQLSEGRVQSKEIEDEAKEGIFVRISIFGHQNSSILRGMKGKAKEEHF